VVAVIRHGDRTPKQKMKMRVDQAPLLDLLHKYMDSKGKQAKLKSPNELQELLDVTRTLLDELDAKQREKEMAGAGSGGGVGTGDVPPPSPGSVCGPLAYNSIDPEADEAREKFRIMKTVLEQGGQFSGINRKVQLKPIRWAAPPEGAATDSRPRVAEALLILKHGGVLTHAGRQQAESLGSLFRNIMYPQHGPAGGGLLRLHSTYRHDLKIYSSDEGRVQSSAAAFTKGLLDLEGSALTPILVSLVKKDAGMLDAFGKGASADINAAKQELYAQMTWDPKTGESMHAVPQMTAPPAGASAGLYGGTPPTSPKIGNGSSDTDGSRPASASAGSALGGVHITRALSATSGTSSVPNAASYRALRAAGVATASWGPPGDFDPDGGDLPVARASNIPGRPHIFPMPQDALATLRTLHDLLKVLVDQLRQKCLEEARGGEDKPKGYSALLQDPKEWRLDPNRPCSGEKLLLVFDRWRKLAKAFYSDKKGRFDISKVPDIYDAAKYDAIHNSHLGVDLEPVYRASFFLNQSITNRV
jgi:inositol-hexakisphosphate/diphosphoinositol-pentakisphosphate 1-kinase